MDNHFVLTPNKFKRHLIGQLFLQKRQARQVEKNDDLAHNCFFRAALLGSTSLISILTFCFTLAIIYLFFFVSS